MEEQKFSLSGSFTKAKEYVDTQLELIKLQAMARTSRLLAALIVDISKSILVLIIIFFLAMALGFYLGELMGSNALGFLTTGGIFLLILVLLRLFEPKVETQFMNLAVRKFYSKWNEGSKDLDDENHSKDINTGSTTVDQQEDEYKNQ